MKEYGVPSTLSEKQRSACDAVGLEMKHKSSEASSLKPNIQLFAKKAEPIIKNIHGEERNIRVNVGRQNKHIPKQNNYENAVRQGKTPSVFYGTADDAQKLVDEFAGTGQLKTPNKEVINFGKIIENTLT